MRKKILAMLLAAVLAAGLLPGTAWAANETSGTCGDNLTWTYSDGVLTISGKGEMDDFPFGYSPWYDQRLQITAVIIETGVTSIEDDAFNSCSNLTTVTIPDSVTSIGDEAFIYCSNLTKVTIPSSVISIGERAFKSCSNLTEISVDVNNQAYSSLDGVLFNKDQSELICYPEGKSATSYVIPGSVISIGDRAFESCNNLTEVVIPASVTSIGDWAFYECWFRLTKVNIPAGVTSIGVGAFARCSRLTEISVDEKNQAYSSLDGVLFNKDQSELTCYPAGKEAASYDIPDSVTSIGDWAFSGCNNLTSMIIPDGVTSIGAGAFSVCNYLTSVTIPESVTFIGNTAFSNCHRLTEVVIPGGVTSIGDRTFETCRSLTEVVIPDGVTSIGDLAFSLCSSLTSITIPDSVTSIGERVFSMCDSLTDVYYGGSEEQWNKISISNSYNDPLFNAKIHYTENEEPTEPEPEQPAEPENPFNDVAEGAWYADSVNWAVEKGITTGTNAEGTTFDPTRDCVDLEILTMLYRADSGESTGDGGDMDRAADWARENGLIGEDYDVTTPCTRATAVWYIWKVLGADESAPAYSFTDVDADAKYAAAVNWAVAKGITNGSEDGTTFSPNDPCDRSMIVTFLYRAYANSVSE